MALIRIDKLIINVEGGELLDEIDRKLDQLMADEQRRYDTIIERQTDMAGELDNVTREVQENGDVIDSAVTVLSELASQIEELKNDPVALQALADSLDANSRKLADAIVANTPAGPTP